MIDHSALSTTGNWSTWKIWNRTEVTPALPFRHRATRDVQRTIKTTNDDNKTYQDIDEDHAQQAYASVLR